MINIRKSAERGGADHGWLNTKHTFSFAEYYDPRHMGFRALRVINEDKVTAGQGFGTHPHRDMEIISYVLEGALSHQDSMGNKGLITPGEVQRMSAGTGVRHSEQNASKTEGAHFLQIWLEPDALGVAPSYEQKRFALKDKKGLHLVASPDGADGSVKINADTKLYGTVLAAGDQVALDLSPGRHAWVHVVRGDVKVNGAALSAGDGAAFSEENKIALEGTKDAEVLLFDLA
ncbi:MAG: pirin family protein [Archangium sp.]|nr:pirin family protein [Archangium sp.]MDP3151340.1 pirin family protein [Archangium sp.]MDP3571603.1 pirin family protein [Archangium sp.]